MTTTETTIVLPAVEVPTSHLEAVRDLIERLSEPGLMNALERFYADQLPVYEAVSRQGDAAFDAYSESTGWGDLHEVGERLVGAIRAALGTAGSMVEYPEWAEAVAERERAALVEDFVGQGRRARESYERGFRDGHALGATGEPMPEDLGVISNAEYLVEKVAAAGAEDEGGKVS